MSISRAQPAHNTPGAASALYLTAVAWIVGGLLLAVVLWRSYDEVGAAGNWPAFIALVVSLFAATVSFASGAILHRMAMWQAAESE